MSFALDDLFIDEDVSKEGVWVEFYGNSKLKVGSTDAGPYKAKLAKLARAHRIQLDDSNPDSFQLIQNITAEALATEVLFDWKGIRMNNQDDIPYTPALGKEALLRSSKLRDFVTEKAAETTLFRREVVESLKKSSNGSLSGGPTLKS